MLGALLTTGGNRPREPELLTHLSMGLFSFLRRDRKAVTDKTPRGRRVGDLPSADIVRTQARRRLVGAAVLVVAAVLVLPWVFDSKPRPVPVDISIDVPKRDLSVALPDPPPARAPVPRASVAEVAPPVVEPGPEVRPVSKPEPQAPAAPAKVPSAAVHEQKSVDETRSVEPSKPVKPVENTKAAEPRKAESAKPSKVPEPVKPAKVVETSKPAKPVDAPRPVKAAEAARAQAMLDGREQAAAGAVPTSKFVVQVGAFEQSEGARDARQRVAKAGLQAHETVVQTSDGRRIRVRLGPYASREEADKAAAKLRAAGVSGAVMPQ